MGAIVIRTRYDEGTESAEVATSACSVADTKIVRSLQLNETRFGPKKRRPRYISAQIISTLFDALDEREIAR